MIEIAHKTKHEPFVGLEEARIFLGMGVTRMYQYILKTKAGKGSFPYYQDNPPRGKYTFIISELKLWRFNKSKGIIK